MVVLESALRRQIFDGIVEKVQSMPSPLREVFVLRHYEGRTEPQIAEIMGIKKTQVDYLLRQAEQLLHDEVHALRPPFEESDPYDFE